MATIDILCDDYSGTCTFQMRSYIYHFSLTKMHRQGRRVMYQKPNAYDLALLFISSIENIEKFEIEKEVEKAELYF